MSAGFDMVFAAPISPIRLTLTGFRLGVCRPAPAYHGRRLTGSTGRRKSKMDLQNAMMNPARAFGTPEAIEASAELSAEEKHAVLLQWKDQLLQLMVATEENMPGPETSSGVNADCLRRVVDALSRIDLQDR
jgi:hypothetical protein